MGRPIHLIALLSQLALPWLAVAAFVPTFLTGRANNFLSVRVGGSGVSEVALFSTPDQRPKPRRTLKKRRGRENKKRRKSISVSKPSGVEEFPWDTAESRPLVTSISKEVGEDYWIDETELQKSLEREEAIKNRKAMEGEIPQEKLRQEVIAPYTQNWIGILSVFIVILAAIIKTEPDLLNAPIIPIPDL